MMNFTLLFVGLVYLNNASSSNTAPFINPCKSDVEKCAIESAKVAIPIIAAGIPKMGIEALDPIFFESFDTMQPHVKFVMSNITLTGMKNCVPLRILRDVPNNKLNLKFACPLKLSGQYNMDGMVFRLIVSQQGGIHIEINNMELRLETDLKTKGNNGENKWEITNYNHSFELKDTPYVSFENLFEVNDVLNAAVKEVIGNNRVDIVKEICGAMIAACVKKIVDNVNLLFNQVLTTELTLDE